MLAEGRPERRFGLHLPEVIGTVVSLDSTDAGLPETPISVDESHVSISKPSNRAAEVYVHLLNFIGRPFGDPPQTTRIVEAISKTTTQLGDLAANSKAQNEAITELTQVINRDACLRDVDKTVIDAEVTRRVETLRKGRFLGAFDTTDESQRLVADLEAGELAFASRNAKANAVAWCARFLSMPAPNEAQRAIDAVEPQDSELNAIARSLIKSARGHLNEALDELTSISTPMGYGAAYICILKAKGFHQAGQWLQEAKLSYSDIDSDAKLFYLKGALENGEWLISFDLARTLTDADFERSPGLLFAAANAHLAQAVPDELRMFLMQYLPFDAANFPLRSEPENLRHRRNAVKLYERMRLVANELKMPAVAGNADDRALWLRLKDPETNAEALRELTDSIEDPATLLRRLNLVLQFGVDINLTQVEREVNRQTAVSGGNSQDAAAARFTLAFTKDSHEAAADYVEQHRQQLLKHLNWKCVYFFQIEMLAAAGQIAKSQICFQEATDRGLTDDESNRLRRLIAETTGRDPIAERLACYEQSSSIADLRLLLEAYKEEENWVKLTEYGKILLDATGDIADARNYAIALYNQERLDDVLEVFSAYPALATGNEGLRLLHAQTLFQLGRVDEARARLTELRQTSNTAGTRQLHVNLAIASGDWESLQSFVESEWSERTDRSAIELIRAGKLAQLIGVARGKDLVCEAAKRAPDDPIVLVNCYHEASVAGWEDSPEVHQWLQRATALSEQSGDGPIQKVSLEGLFESQPDWEKRETNNWNLLASGDIPMFSAGQYMNHSLLKLFLFPAVSNLSEMDVRRRPLIYAFSGARGTRTVDPSVIAMDPTALMTAEFLGILGLCIDTFERIVIPHNTLGWLIEEKAQILFHQPSRVAAAHDLRRMISKGHLRIFECSVIVPDRLVHEVGEGLAALIAEASSEDHPGTEQRLVVRGGPVHRANSFMKEEADLAAYESHICSSVDVVDKLVQKGVLTAPEAEVARTALHLRERPWPTKVEITDGAILYLDDVTVAHLSFLGLLPKLHRASITVVVARSEIEEADALIAHDAKGAEVVSIVERIRTRLREGLERGKIKLGRSIGTNSDDRHQRMMAHPTVAILKLMDEVDAAIIDDRFVNRHSSISSATSKKPLLTMPDILDLLHHRGVLTAGRKQEARTILRRANFALMPLGYDELARLVCDATVKNDVLIETAELRAVRESILRLKMSDILQSPAELPWLNGMIGACLLALRDQWKEGSDESSAAARSDWLLSVGDLRDWAHRLTGDDGQLTARYQNWVALLMMLPAAQPESVRRAYWRWFESRILDEIREYDPATYTFLIKHAKLRVAQAVELSVEDHERPYG